MKQSSSRSGKRVALALLVTLALGLGSSSALAAVRRVGEWPSGDEKVSLSLESVSRADAIKRLADEAGWSVVVQASEGEPVELHVKHQPAVKVLELLLDDGRYVAKRTGTLIAIAGHHREIWIDLELFG